MSPDEMQLEAQHRNLVILFASSAGGAFSALAQATFRAGGFVGGAVWTETFGTRLVLTDDRADLPLLRGIKYAMAETEGFHDAVREALATGRPILVCAAPCQIAALRKAVGAPEQLTLVDFVCPGIPDAAALRTSLDEWEAHEGSRVAKIRFEATERGARARAAKLVFANKHVKYVFPDESPFLAACQTGDAASATCANCPFRSGKSSEADVTFGCRHGVAADDPPEFARDLGITTVTVRTDQGRKAAETIAAACVTREGFGTPKPPKRKRKPHRTGLSEFFKLARKLRFSPRAVLHAALANGIRRILSGPLIWTASSTVQVVVRGRLQLGGKMMLGFPFAKTPEIPRGTLLFVDKNSTLRTKGMFIALPGSRVEAVHGGTLEIGEDTGFNAGAYISCADRIVIGNDVRAGRGVTIRDTNGGHWMNLPGYRNTKPVEIGDHVWLCEGCTVMPGVKIGSGAVVGERAVVFGNVPANALVMGNPAKVVCEQVEWKY